VEHPIPIEELPPEVARACGPSAPGPLKLMAARGMLPLAAPTDLVTLLYELSFDPAEPIRAAASDTLVGLPDDVLEAALSGELDARVLDHAADAFADHEDLTVTILRNARTDDETVERAAKRAGDSVLELIAANETRLLRAPRVIEALYMNKRTRMSTVDRVIELAVRNGLVLENIPAFREIAAALEGQIIVEADLEPAPEDLQFAAVVSFEEFGDPFADLAGGDEFAEFDSSKAGKREQGEEDETAERRVKLGLEISHLTVSQKIRLALLGNASHRAMLIRDSNRLVSMAAIKSPAMTDQEVSGLSQSRAVSEEVIRYIADNREWTKSYVVKCNLVNNPKCPLGQSLRFLPHLRQRDLKMLTSNKNVPQALAVAARQLLQRRPGAA
jgi:hypothetical protein